MGSQSELNTRLCNLIEKYGTTIAFVSRATRIDQSQLNKFKLGKLFLEPHQMQRLDQFLSERSY